MILVTGTTDTLEVVTDASADIEVHASYVTNNSGTYTPGRTNTASITSNTTTTVVAAPGASQQRAVTGLSIRNNHASVSCNVTVQHNDGTNVETIILVNLLAGESLILGENGQWIHYDVNGGPYPALGNIASQSDLEGATSVTTVVTPGRVKFHPGVAKFWVIAGTSGNVLASYNVTSLTDTGTGVLGITIETDFSSVNYCVAVSVEATGTTWAVANTRECHIRNATLAAGTVSVDCIDNTTTTCLVKDPNTWHVVGFGDQ